MTVGQDSRYVAANQSTVLATTDAFPERGNIVTMYVPPVLFKHSGYIRYQIKQGDTFWKLAAEHLGGSNEWWRIADMNPQIFYPDDLTPGIIIRMPL